ncbi:MAG TPA: hypothetical protein VFC55_01990 [Desulfobaccales bacterium]|nr:hypothetical protein [Desulfobaccales bacterium]
MISINIPGFKELRLSHLVLDYNGTIAAQGRLRTARGGERTAPTGTFRNREPGVVRQMG